jgi:DNA-binding response OmpR family regulator
MTTRRVLILEDKADLRLSLTSLLRSRGFKVEGASDVRSAHDSMRRMEGDIDVMILDMRLEDEKAPDLIGADVGLEILMQQADSPPEFLIYSGYIDITDYYKKALKLGVAAYLDKSQVDILEVISHIRVLALRRSLSMWNEPLLQRIQRLAESSREESEAIVGFCESILKPEIEEVLGTPFILLLSDDRTRGDGQRGTTAFCGTGLDLPQTGVRFYSALQHLLFLPGTYGGHQILSRDLIAKMGFEEEQEVLSKLVGAHFIPLAEKGGFRLSLGVASVSRIENLFAEDPDTVVRLMDLYFRPSVIYQLLRVTELWAKAQAQARKNRLIEDTGNLFLNVGREQVTILDDATRAGEIMKSDTLVHIPRLQALGEDLRDAGEALKNLIEDPGTQDRMELAALIRQVWKVLASLHEIASPETLEVRGELWVGGNGERFYAIFSRILGWFAERLRESGVAGPAIRITLSAEGGYGMVAIEDDSLRLAEPLRRRLFDPFALGGWRTSYAPWGVGRRLSLYLAKLLLESQPGSCLEDRTDQLGGEKGHRLVLRLPIAA